MRRRSSLLFLFLTLLAAQPGARAAVTTVAPLPATEVPAAELSATDAVILGVVTAVGGGTLRDVLTNRVPVVLRSELYAIPAACAAGVVVLAQRSGFYGIPVAIAAAVLCFVIRMVGVRYRLDAPRPPGGDRE